jgi:hypothetical protein
VRQLEEHNASVAPAHYNRSASALTPSVIADKSFFIPQSPNRNSAQGDTEWLPSAVDEIGAMMWKVQIGEEGETSFIGPSGNFCFSSANTKSTHDCLPSKDTITSSDSTNSDFHLNNPATVNCLCNLFSVYLNPFHQFVEASTLINLPSQSPNDLSFDFLRSAVCAAGACFADRSDLREVGESFALHAENIALRCCRLYPNLITIQALTILCWRGLSLEHENMAWLYNSMAASLCIHLGLHVGSLEHLNDTSGRLKASNEQQSLRIRTLWQFFLIDRISTSLLGRQCTLPWRRIKTPFLDSTFTFTPSQEIIAFDHQCKLWFLHDRYMDQM